MLVDLDVDEIAVVAANNSLVCLIGHLAMLEPPRPAAVLPETQTALAVPSFERTAPASVSCVLSLSISALA
jgi:hypothetical protein